MPRVTFISGVEPGGAAWSVSSWTRTGGHRRSWRPQVELIGHWLFSAVLLNAECSKPGVKYTGGVEPFSRASFKCPVQLYITLKKKLLPSFHLLPPPHPIITCAPLSFTKKGCIWQPHFQRRPEILVILMTKTCFYYFPFATIALKLKDFHYIFLICVVCLFLLTSSVNII